MRIVTFWDDLVDVVNQKEANVQVGQPVWLNPNLQLNDVYTMALSAVVLVALKLMFLSFAEYKLFPSVKQYVRGKLFENLFYTLFYIVSFSFGVWTIRREDWHWRPFTNDGVDIVESVFSPFPPEMSGLFKAYYATQTGYYIGLLISIVVDTRRSDFRQYLLHHITTLTLMVVSFTFGMVRIGLCILLLHDLCDIFLHGTKAVHYCKLAGIDTFLFVIFAVCFFVCRLVAFPRLVWTVVVEVLIYCKDNPDFNNWVAYYDTYLPLWLIFSVLLCTLVLLNCFWMALILRIIHREVSGSGSITNDGDIRSDSEDEDD